MHHQPQSARTVVLAALSAAILVVLAAIPAGAMSVTFIRHAQSQSNAAGFINTETPGPLLTDLGWTEAENLPAKLVDQGIDAELFDNFYASTMTRTQLTAEPLLESLNKTVKDDLTVIGLYDPSKPQSVAGIQEISAGIFEGSPEGSGIGRLGMGLIPLGWTLGLRFLRIPGSEDGNEFDARIDEAIEQMRAGGDANGDGEINVAAFSHGGTIMFWTMMNVDNPNLLLMLQNQLNNTDVVVVEENGRGGWTLKSWKGIEVGEANYLTKMFVNFRDLIVAPQTALFNLRQPIFDLDGKAFVLAAGQGARDVADAAVTFVRNSITDTVEEIRRHLPTPSAKSGVSTLAARTSNEDAEVDVTRPGRDVVRQLRSARAELATTLADKRGELTTRHTDRREAVRAKFEERHQKARESLTQVRDNAHRTLGVRTASADRTAKADNDAA